STFRAKNTPKSGPYKTKNNAQTTSEQLQTNFQKFQKTVFCDPENGQNDPLRGPNFEPKILILEVIYRSFELKIQLKVGILRPKIMPKQLSHILYFL
ncbi:MAG: hypothetical protein AAFP20_25715, partial [Cyanobacteria bacterium J06614_10]